MTEKCSGADLKAVVDQTIEVKLADALRQGMPSPISTKDLLKTAKAVKTSTAQWFASATNYALYANEGGDGTSGCIAFEVGGDFCPEGF